MREMRREPEVTEEKVPVVECHDGITHFVKNGTLQNACLVDQEWLSVWGEVLIRTPSG